MRKHNGKKKSTKKTLKPVRPQLGDGVEILNARQRAGGSHYPYAGNQLYALRHERHRQPRAAGDRRLQAGAPQAAVHHVRDGSAQGRTHQICQHRGQHHAPESPRRRRHLRHMVRMGRGNESLLVPFVDSKGNFGKAYSRDMSCAAARYTEAKLESVCEELFRISTRRLWTLCPTTTAPPPSPPCCRSPSPPFWPTTRWGIAVGMACNICSFNLGGAVCHHRGADEGRAPRYRHHHARPGLCGRRQIVYDEAQMREIYENGRAA